MNPTVIVPGIKGSGIENYYPTDPTVTWSSVRALTAPPLREIQLDVTGLTDESDDVLNRPTCALGVAYDKLVHGLRGRLNAPVYVFPYDWRLSNQVNAKRLLEFVERLRDKPMRSVPGWRDTGRKLHFVCHSMGGLCVRSFLAQWAAAKKERPPVDTLTFIATPHLGSLDAVRALIAGDSPILDYQKELRKLARCLPSVYELLPRFAGVVDQQGQAMDIFQAGNWQSNATQPTPGGLEDVTQSRLDAASAFLNALPDPLAPEFGLQGRVLCVCGAKARSTLSRVVVEPVRAAGGRAIQNWYDFANATQGVGDEVVLTGSAELPGAAVTHIPYDAVDLRISEIFAKFSFHAGMCVLDETQTVVAAFICDPPGYRKDLPLNIA